MCPQQLGALIESQFAEQLFTLHCTTVQDPIADSGRNWPFDILIDRFLQVRLNYVHHRVLLADHLVPVGGVGPRRVLMTKELRGLERLLELSALGIDSQDSLLWLVTLYPLLLQALTQD